MKYIAACALLAASFPAFSENYATCLIDGLPGTSNHAAHEAIVQTCLQKHPSGFSRIKIGEGRGWFGFKSGAECTIKKAKDTTFPTSAGMIGMACRCLYNQPVTVEFEGKPLHRLCA